MTQHFPRMTRRAEARINAQGGEPCVLCSPPAWTKLPPHPEVVHASGQHGAECYMCKALPLHSRVAKPVHDFEGKAATSARTLLSMLAARVRSLAVGERFTVGLNDYVVGAPCRDDEDGYWVCASHAKRFTGESGMPGNTERDVHLFDKYWPSPHLVVWNCMQHGPERGDVVVPFLDPTRSGDS